jgi:hypothetical protein
LRRRMKRGADGYQVSASLTITVDTMTSKLKIIQELQLDLSLLRQPPVGFAAGDFKIRGGQQRQIPYQEGGAVRAGGEP